MIPLHNIGEEESSRGFFIQPEAATQISPEGTFEWEVPWSRDAVLSCKLNRLLINIIKSIMRSVMKL